MTTYPPLYHKEFNYQNAIRVINRFPFATLASSHKEKIFITHLPLIYDQDDSKYGKLIGHIDLKNPQSKYLNGRQVTAVFHGPSSYISPYDYKSEGLLPTWNHITVHLKGLCSITESRTEVKQSIVSMTNFLEPKNDGYTLSINNPQMDKLIDYILGFEIEINEWDGKFKLSQDKSNLDIESAKQKLIRASSISQEHFINTIFSHHHNSRLENEDID